MRYSVFCRVHGTRCCSFGANTAEINLTEHYCFVNCCSAAYILYVFFIINLITRWYIRYHWFAICVIGLIYFANKRHFRCDCKWVRFIARFSQREQDFRKLKRLCVKYLSFLFTTVDSNWCMKLCGRLSNTLLRDGNNYPTRWNNTQFIYICQMLWPRSQQVAVTVSLIPDTVDTVLWAPDDGWNTTRNASSSWQI